MTYIEVIKRSIPGTPPEIMEHILWGRTAFPFKKINARDLYKAATRFIRASNKGITLCDHCDRIAKLDSYICERCDAIKRVHKETNQ